MRERIYINSENMATIICPVCKKSRNTDVSSLLASKKAININCKCKCGHTFGVTLERRKFYRKEINFNGKCYLGNDDLKINVIITDISRSGLQFKLNAEHTFQIGDELLIEFNIDDAEKSLISKKIIVKSVTGLKVGAEFKSSEHYDKLGSYLMYH
jgi:hypothetical protein